MAYKKSLIFSSAFFLITFSFFACTQEGNDLFVVPANDAPNQSFYCRDYSSLTDTKYNGGILCDPCYRWGYLGCSSNAYQCLSVTGINASAELVTENFCLCATGYTTSFPTGKAPNINQSPPPTCEACAPNCNSCDLSGPGLCDKGGCAPGFTLQSQQCAACGPNCNSCDQNGPGFCDPGQCIQPYAYSSSGCALPCGNSNWCCHQWFQDVYYLSETGWCPGLYTSGASCENCCSDPEHTCLD